LVLKKEISSFLNIDEYEKYVKVYKPREYEYIHYFNGVETSKREIKRFYEKAEHENNELLELIDNEIKEQELVVKKEITKECVLQHLKEHICLANEIKEKNKNISNYIADLKNNDKLNVWYKYEDKYRPKHIHEIIENGTYHFDIKYAEWDYCNLVSIKYWFGVNKILANQKIKFIERKFNKNDKDKAMSYYNSRKKYYKKYFTEEKPAILEDWADCITKHGIGLNGYKILDKKNKE